jgi:hypothetical protein
VKRSEVEHVIRAAAAITDDEIVVIGSQAILGQVSEPPESMLESMEADLYPRAAPERAIEIDGPLGDGSRFHEQFGYYAHGVGPETPIPPAGWEARLVRVVLPPIGVWKKSTVAWFLETNDLILAKLAAGRPNDISFAIEAIRSGLVDPDNLRRGAELMPESHRDITTERLETAIARASADPS